MPTPIDYTKNKQFEVHHLSGKYSGIQFVDDKEIDPNGSQTPKDRSFSYWGNAWKTFIKLFQGNIFYNAVGNLSLNAGEEVHLTAHNKQETTSGGSAFYNKGETVRNHGELTEEDKANMAQMQEYLEQIHQKSLDAIKNTKGEEVVCPNCAQQHLADDKSDNFTIIFDKLRGLLDNFPYLQGPFAVLRTIVMKVYVPLLGVKTNIGLNEGKGCGPGCEAGIKEGMSLKVQASEKAVKEEMDKLSEKMNALTASMKPVSTSAQIHAHNEIHFYGNPTAKPPAVKPYVESGPHHSLPMNLRPASTLKNKLRVSTEGNCKVVMYHPAPQPPYGNLMIQVQNNLKITSGNNGTEILSLGEIAIKGGSVHINGSEGEVSLTSKNLTTIGGGNVLIAADNKGGDTGVCIDSKHTYVRGSFNVNGDSAMLGSLTIDGALSVPYINCPTMAAPVTLNGSSKFCTHGAAWEVEGLGLKSENFSLDLVTKYLFQPTLIMTKSGITDIITEAYNLILLALTIEIIPTGIYLGFCANAAGPGVSWGWMFNFTHAHGLPVSDHTHEAPVPKGSYYKTLAGAGAQRVAGNPAPTPAPTSGCWPSPHPRALGGGCGGGGLYSKVRNQKYGIDSEDALNGGNFVTATPVRNPDGSLIPTPDLTYRVVNDNGADAIIDKNTGKVIGRVPVENCVTD